METTTGATGSRPPVGTEGRRQGRLRRWWRNTSLRRKLLTVASLAMLACVPPMVVAFALLVRVDDVRSTTRHTQRLADRLDRLQDTLAEADFAVRYYAILSFNDPVYVQDFRRAAAEVPGQLAAIRDRVPADLAEPARAMDAAVRNEVVEMERLVAFDPAGDSAQATDAQLATDRPPDLLGQLLVATEATHAGGERLEHLEALVADRLASQRQDLDRLESLLGWSIVGGWIAALAIIMIGIWVVASGIVRRIETLSRNGQRFLLGQPLIPEPRSKDEIGRLSDGILITGELLDQRRREAVAANRTKDELISRISHELRTPLTAVIGFGQILEDDDELSADNRECADHIVSGGQHMLSLINDLIDVSTLDTGHLAVLLGPVRVCEVAHDTATLVQSLADARSVGLDLRCPDEDLLVAADPQRLRQVLLNLLSNAIKYNREGGHVDLAVEPRDGETVRISVADTGHGIPPEGLDRLFQPFERLDAARTGVGGTGIGLALSKRLVEAMHGTIGVDSEVGTGSTFWVELPTAAPGDARWDEPTAADARPRQA